MPPKYQTIADELKIHIQAGKYADAQTLPTEFVIAEEYQVSRQTVRHALALLAEEGLIEKRQGSGSHILHTAPEPPAQHRSVAVITTYISDYIFPSILRAVEDVLSRNNCTPSLFATQNQVANERRILQNILKLPIDGILVEGTKTALPNSNLDLYRQLMNKGIPLVFMHGDYAQLHGAVSVLDDNEGGGRMLVEYLLSKGHTRIAGIFKSDDIQGHGRYSGYTSALRDAGHPVDDSLVYWYTTDQKMQFFSGQDIFPVHQWIDSGCTAVVCYNDEIANQLIISLKSSGISVPGDLAVVSFDNSQYAKLSTTPITSLSHGEFNVGDIAARDLLSLMNGEPCQSESVPWTLIERISG